MAPLYQFNHQQGTVIESYQNSGSIHQHDDAAKSTNQRDDLRRSGCCHFVWGGGSCLAGLLAAIMMTISHHSNRIMNDTVYISNDEESVVILNVDVETRTHCSDFFGKVFDGRGMIDTSSEEGDTDIAVLDFTVLTFPTDDGNVGKYYMYDHSVATMGGAEYLEHGTIRLLDGYDTRGMATNCLSQFDAHSFLGDNNKWEVDHPEFSFNSWDGESWILSGLKDFRAGARHQSQAAVLFPIPRKDDCILRVNDLIAAFSGKGISLPEAVSFEMCP